jgi:2-polyprenyl-3-methyl-5-hydroxy-6-metoxy-1,4-benzoquinol methylase
MSERAASLDPADATAASRHAYDGWHARLDVDATLETPWHRLIMQLLSERTDLLHGHVLEMGAGRGGFACWLAIQPAVRRVVAADLSSVAILKGRTHAAEIGSLGLDWLVGDLQAVPVQSDTFDTVVSCETIEHVSAPRQALREIFRVLRPGGRLILTCPNYFGPLGLYRAYLRFCGRRFTEEGQPINRLLLLPLTIWWLRTVGFQVGVVDGIGHYLPWFGAPPRDLGSLRPRRLTKWVALHSCVIAFKPE